MARRMSSLFTTHTRPMETMRSTSNFRNLLCHLPSRTFSHHCRLEGKAALVTGGARGIGEAIVRLFHSHGAKVSVVDIRDDLGRRLCGSLGDGTTAIFTHGDVTSEDDVSASVDLAVSQFGRLDILVNCAGITGPAGVELGAVGISDFEDVFDVNVKGVLLGMKHASRVMVPAKRGSIVSISSISGVLGGPGPHIYAGSKQAVVGLTRSAAAELGAYGIRVNCVSPYGVLTDLSLSHLPRCGGNEDAAARFRAFFLEKANLKGVELTADDVANATLFLAGDEARYVSGLNLLVDGGFSSVNNTLKSWAG